MPEIQLEVQFSPEARREFDAFWGELDTGVVDRMGHGYEVDRNCSYSDRYNPLRHRQSLQSTQ